MKVFRLVSDVAMSAVSDTLYIDDDDFIYLFFRLDDNEEEE